MVISYFLPRLRLLTAYSLIDKSVRFSSPALAVLASFSFFTNTSVIKPSLPSIYSKLTALTSHPTIDKTADKLIAAFDLEVMRPEIDFITPERNAQDVPDNTHC